MILKIEDIKGETIGDIVKELANMPEFMAEIAGQALRGGDFLELIAQELVFGDTSIDTRDYWETCK